jgi:hypothetical protein
MQEGIARIFRAIEQATTRYARYAPSLRRGSLGMGGECMRSMGGVHEHMTSP